MKRRTTSTHGTKRWKLHDNARKDESTFPHYHHKGENILRYSDPKHSSLHGSI